MGGTLLGRRTFLAGLFSPISAHSLSSASGRAAGKGSRIEARAAASPDELTGRRTWRLTDPAVLHHMPHYHHRFIAANSKFMLVAGEHSGSRQIYRMKLPGGDLTQLTSGPGIHPYSPTLCPKERRFYYLQSNTLKRLSVKGRGERRIYQTESGWRMTGHLAVSDHARYAAIIEMASEDWVEGFEEQFARRPRCRIRIVDLKKGGARTLVEEPNWLAHPRFRPRGSDLLFCREGPWEKVNGRLWLVSLDGRRIKNLRPRQGSEALGHAYWTRFGNEICYAFYPDATGRGATLRCFNVTTGKERILAKCSKFGWLMGNHDNSAIVGASRSLAGPNLYVLFPRLRREITIAEHASSAEPYPLGGTSVLDPFAAWPEPVFSPDSRCVFFVSDREGQPAIYRIEVADLVEDLPAS